MPARSLWILLLQVFTGSSSDGIHIVEIDPPFRLTLPAGYKPLHPIPPGEDILGCSLGGSRT